MHQRIDGWEAADVSPIPLREDKTVKLLPLQLFYISEHLQIFRIDLGQYPGGDRLWLAELGADMGQVSAGDKAEGGEGVCCPEA